jgi:N-methylhydantoinase B
VSGLDPIELQVIVGALRAACEEMGATLVRSAHSANIKERRDASTALFDRDGEMVMQAEHIPVHLGSMPAAVGAVLGQEHRPGVSWVLNDPYAGGTHLPDITVVTPVFGVPDWGAPRARMGQPDLQTPTTSPPSAHTGGTYIDGHATASAGPLLGFAASRAHHADVGGRVPGSMPADSRTLEEEGVVIHPRPLTAATIEELVAQMRNPEERRADLRAQLAANRTGAQRLAELGTRVGAGRLEEAMEAVLDYAERRTRACLVALPDGVREAEDVLEAPEGDLVLRLKATVEGERLVLDFSGSAGQHEGNLNCPLAVTLSACWFAVKVLTDPDIPPSAGAYRPVQVIAPEGSLLNAQAPDHSTGERSASALPAVAAGNVETSSRVADLVLGAFGRALGQGTMNNLTLGNEDFTYYETLGGGQGACEDADGPSGVHVAMSNTLNTPVEALERELPVLVGEYSLRRGSGGAGRHRGGDGVVREVEALSEMTFSLIGERRRHAPPGAAGGEPGKRGRDTLIGADGETRGLPAKVTGTLHGGERLRIETPGGGGYGPAAERHDPPARAALFPPEPGSARPSPSVLSPAAPGRRTV